MRNILKSLVLIGILGIGGFAQAKTSAQQYQDSQKKNTAAENADSVCDGMRAASGIKCTGLTAAWAVSMCWSQGDFPKSHCAEKAVKALESTPKNATSDAQNYLLTHLKKSPSSVCGDFKPNEKKYRPLLSRSILKELDSACSPKGKK